MGTRRWMAVLASVAVVLGLVAPTSAAAAPHARRPAVVTPDGRALIHIEAGTATAQRLGRLKYRVTVPREVFITWLGQVSGHQHVGSFTAHQLVRAWNGMGYSRNAKALATLVWGTSPASRARNHRVVLLSDPRVAPGGRLTFLVTALRSSLPLRMPFLEFHIARAGAAPAASPVRRATLPPSVSFSSFYIDPALTASVQAAETDNDSATITWPTATDPCRGPINVTADPTTGVGQVIFQGFPCGDGAVSGKVPYPSNSTYAKYVQLNSTVSFQPMLTAGGSGNIWVQFGYTPTGSTTMFYFGQTIGLWDTNGCIFGCGLGY